MTSIIDVLMDKFPRKVQSVVLGLTATLLLCSASVYAAWEESYRILGATAYVDWQLTQRDGERTQFVELVNYVVAKKIPEESPYKSLLALTQLDCKLQRVREAVYQFPKSMAQGEGRLQLSVSSSELAQFRTLAAVDMDAVYASHHAIMVASKPPVKVEKNEERSMLGRIFDSSAAPLGPSVSIAPMAMGTTGGGSEVNPSMGDGVSSRSGGSVHRTAFSMLSVPTSAETMAESPEDVKSRQINAELEAMGWRSKGFMNHRFLAIACPGVAASDVDRPRSK